MEQKLLDTLKKYWHYDSFRPMQREAMESVLSGHDTLVLMPTGGGKSLIYQVPTMASDGICIVITPLIALMKDQVDNLRRKGIPAVAVHSGLSSRQIDIALDNCVYGDVKFLYIAPERMSSQEFQLRVGRMKVAILAVDEAHCISQWGYDFRPSYLRIKELRRIMPDTPVLALTASATQRVAKDIMEQLDFAEPNILQSSFARPNLSYSVRETEDKNQQLLRIVNNVPGCGIVYMRTRKGTEEIAQFLIDEGHSAAFYHAGLPNAERAIRQDEWIAGKTRIMVATNAFGMGIDKSDVRFVVHYTMCDSLESYYQEAGRAGRDGKRSYAVILKSEVDEQRITSTLEKEFAPIELIRSTYHHLCSYLGVAIGDGKESSFVFNIYDFCRHVKMDATTVHNIIKMLQLNGYLTLVEDGDHPARVMFTIKRDELYGMRHTEKEERILHAILRCYSGIFNDFRPISEMEIATWAECSHEEVYEFLKRMWRTGAIRYIPTNHDPLIFFDEERLPSRDIYIAPETYSRRKELMLERFDHMLHYANEEEGCRSHIIEEYFSDSKSAACGICDNCLARKRNAKQAGANGDLERQILELLAEGATTIKRLVSQIPGNETSVLEAVRRLVDNGKIEADEMRLKLK
ncbi:MAG: RecQ family ATP-dependent DNA helicase [Alistipes sp.]|nr:RecQ family ATP-dependent DNA helicase [Alistipes sp.]